MPIALPIDAHLDEILDRVRSHGAAVVVAPPGSGKTTRVAPALAADGPVILLQPRRLAARALARRIAAENGWVLGREVGWQVRMERRFSADTRVLVATEGILTARLQGDPLLEAFRTVVLDEFHERSLHADLALALGAQAREARRDLRLVVLSATLDPAPVAAFLGGCPALEIPGRAHPVTIEHAPGADLAAAARAALGRTGGHVLCFLPGAPEIERARRELEPVLPPDVHLLPLHGSLDADRQDAALAPSTRRKLILATNLAETSLTVEGVTHVIDSGLHKILRRDPSLGIDRLETERISRDAAEQRAGRAGRTAPGHVVRLWDERAVLRPEREPEIERVDLAGPLLDVLAWGDDPRRFRWFQAPPSASVDAALELLEKLGATASGRLTELGRALRALPLHPRLGRVLLACDGDELAARACASLAEGRARPAGDAATTCDLLSLDGTPRDRRAARELARLAARHRGRFAVDGAEPEERLRRAVLAGYPDRAARRRRRGGPRLVLASGHGAVLSRESNVRGGAFLVAVELRAGRRGPGSEARVHLASRIEPAWLEPTERVTTHELDRSTGQVRAVERVLHGALVLREHPREAEAGVAARLLADAMLERGLGDDADAAARRLAFAGLGVDVPALLRTACAGRRGWFRFDLLRALPGDVRRQLDRLAPASLRVPSGRRVALDYRGDGSVHAAVKLQEMFGCAETPRVGARREPVTFALLAPNGRPVQTTRDLASFWTTTYAQVRKELRGRYPKHPWPEDPWSAPPTGRTRRSPKGPDSFG